MLFFLLNSRPSGDSKHFMVLAVPDLLTARARVRVDVGALKQTLVFAFAAGSPQEAFDDAVAGAALPSSSWHRSTFARDLYVDELVDKLLRARIDGKTQRVASRYVARVLAAPPSDMADVDVRRGVLSELAGSPAKRLEIERIYLAIVRIRDLLCAARQPAPRVRRVEILRAAKDAFDLLAGAFDGSSSALQRVRAFGRAVLASQAYARLASFLEYDDHLAALEIRVRVGADGEVRAMQLVGVRENRRNPFYVPLLSRLLVRLALFVRGFRTTPGEIAERLLLDVFSGLEEPLVLLFQLLGDMDVLLGSLSFRDLAVQAGLPACLPTFVEPEAPLEIVNLYNPLLLAAGISPIPCDVRAGPRAIVVVTGPNSGGKTRLLQSLATTQLLAQAGLFVPARSASLAPATGLFASLFEEAHSEQREGHLGMELLRIRRLFDEADADALVVLDELCSGTNPSEGEEIARLVLSLLPALGVRAFVTTHLLALAAALRADPSSDLEFLQVELEEGERPTYRFVPGVARTSLAHKTAARLGVTRDELVALIAAKGSKRAAASQKG